MDDPTCPSPSRCLALSSQCFICRGVPVWPRAAYHSKEPSVFSVSVGDVYMLLGASVVDTLIPLLASNTLLETLDAVIDIGKQQVFFRKIGVKAHIIKFQGHLAISISSFDADSHRLPVWKSASGRTLTRRSSSQV